MPLSTSAERNSFAQDLFTPLPARYDRLAEILSFGQNGRWRRAMVDQIVRPPAVSCSTSHQGPLAWPLRWQPAPEPGFWASI